MGIAGAGAGETLEQGSNQKKKTFHDLRILYLALQLLQRSENSKGKLRIRRGFVVYPEHLREKGTGRL